MRGEGGGVELSAKTRCLLRRSLPCSGRALTATSHSSAFLRHITNDGKTSSTGHVADRPVHFSALSHAPFDGRHSVAGSLNVSGGQSGEPAGWEPLLPTLTPFWQNSGTSHSPADARHITVGGW